MSTEIIEHFPLEEDSQELEFEFQLEEE